MIFSLKLLFLISLHFCFCVIPPCKSPFSYLCFLLQTFCSFDLYRQILQEYSYQLSITVAVIISQVLLNFNSNYNLSAPQSSERAAFLLEFFISGAPSYSVITNLMLSDEMLKLAVIAGIFTYLSFIYISLTFSLSL